MEAVWIGVGVLVLVAVIARAARRRRSSADAVEAIRGLRERALTADAEEIGVTPEPGKPWGIVMETGYPGAVVSLVAFADGSASLYFSSGGGLLGGGEHANVNAASRAFVARAATEMQHFEPATGHPSPAEGVTRFYLRTETGLLTAAAPENDLGEGRHPLSTLFLAGQDLLGELRVISEQRSQAPGN